MILLDTRDLPAPKRVEAFNTAMMDASVPCRIVHEDPDGDVHARMDLWGFGTCTLFTAQASGFRLIRTPKHIRIGSQPILAVAIQTRGRGLFEQHGHQQVVGGHDLMLNDLTEPYDFAWYGDGASKAFQVTYDQLGLPIDVVRKAAGRLHTSPLHNLVHQHLSALARDAQRLSLDPGANALASATTELLRALVVSAAQDHRHSRAVRADTLLTRVLSFTRWHLTEHDLTPESIASAHNISVRSLYKLCEQAGLSLEQWIITQRLEGARRDLASPNGRRRTIASVARAWGFSDPSHFTRKFHSAYGVLPKDWQRTAR